MDKRVLHMNEAQTRGQTGPWLQQIKATHQTCKWRILSSPIVLAVADKYIHEAH